MFRSPCTVAVVKSTHRTQPEGWPSDALMDYRQIAGNSAINFDAILMKLMDSHTARRLSQINEKRQQQKNTFDESA